ncbi:MAG: MoaD/ThiS family protein [Halodesulfurarchaeum sp.]
MGNQRPTTKNRGESDSTTVTVRCTGHVREAVGAGKFTYTFTGTTLGDFLSEFFEEHPIEDLVLASEPEDEAPDGWAEPPDELPGTWRQNPPGERTRKYARITVNGTFNVHLDGFRTELEDGDRVAMMNPFVFCF